MLGTVTKGTGSAPLGILGPVPLLDMAELAKGRKGQLKGAKAGTRQGLWQMDDRGTEHGEGGEGVASPLQDRKKGNASLLQCIMNLWKSLPQDTLRVTDVDGFNRG